LAAVMAHEIAHVAAPACDAADDPCTHLQHRVATSCVRLRGRGLAAARRSGRRHPTRKTKFAEALRRKQITLDWNMRTKLAKTTSETSRSLKGWKSCRTKKSNIVVRAFSTHPEASDRVRKLQNEIAKILPPRTAYLLSGRNLTK
jgi:hypothetical protein